MYSLPAMIARSAFAALIGMAAACVASAQQPVSLTEGVLAGPPAVISGASNFFVVLWSESKTQDSTMQDFNVFLQEFDGNGSPTSARLMVNEAFAGRSISPAGAYVGGGCFVLAWVDSVRKDRLGIVKARVFDTSTKILGPVVALSPATLPAGSPNLTSDSEGTCLLAFSYAQANGRPQATACVVLAQTLKPLSQTTTLKGPDGSDVTVKGAVASCRPGVWSIPSPQWRGSLVVVVSRSNPSGFGPLACSFAHAPMEFQAGREPEWGAYLSDKEAFAWLVRESASKGGFVPDDPSMKTGRIPLSNGNFLIRGTSVPGRPAEGRAIMTDRHGNQLWRTDLQELAVALPVPSYLYMSALHGTVLAVRGEKSKTGRSIVSASIVCGANVFAKPPASPKIAEIHLPAGSIPGEVAASPLFARPDRREPTAIIATWTTVRREKGQSFPSTYVGVFPVAWREMRMPPASK
jgi:hypothetical protein